MTLPAPTKTVNIDSRVPAEEPARWSQPQGWDPFEVWRTRILIPRLAAAAVAAQPDASTVPAKLARR